MQVSRFKTWIKLVFFFILAIILITITIKLDTMVVPDEALAYPPPTSRPGTPSQGPYKSYLPFIAGKQFAEFSYYIASTNQLYQLGQKRGNFYAGDLSRTSGVVILDFGIRYGDDNHVQIYDGETLTLDNVMTYVETYINGIINRIGASPVIIDVVVGINSSGYLTQGFGANWGTKINQLNSWAAGMGYSGKIIIKGGNDMETQWRSRGEARSWVAGYNSTSSYPAYNFGNTAGCPQFSPPTQPQYQSPNSSSCPTPTNSTWTQDDIYYVSWIGEMFPLPEIYNTVGANSDQWYRIGLYTFFKNNYLPMQFKGTLTTHYGCIQSPGPDCNGANLHPGRAFSELSTKISSDPYGRISNQMRFKTDIIHYYGDPKVEDSFTNVP